MYPTDMTPPRQTTQRHRRSDRYLADGQAPVPQQPVAQRRSQPVGPSSFPNQAAPAAYPHQAPQRAQAPQQPIPQQRAQAPQQPQQPQQPQSSTLHPQPAAPYQQQSSARMQPPQSAQMHPAAAYPQQPASPAYHQPTPYPYPDWNNAPQPTPYGAANGQQPQQGYGWEGAQQPYRGQGGWQQPYYAPQPYAPGMTMTGMRAGMDDAPQPLSAVREMQPDQGGPDGGRPWRFPWMVLLIALAVVAVIVVSVVGGRKAVESHQTHTYVAEYNDKFCQGVYVDGIHLGGMTQEEAINAVTAQAQRRNNEWYVRLTYQGQEVVSFDAAQLGMQVDVYDALRDAWQQGHASSDVNEREAAMRQLLLEPYYGTSALPRGDTGVVDDILRQLQELVYRAPKDAVITEFDPAKTYPFTFQAEEAGRMLNTDGLKEQIYQMVATMKSGDLEIEPEVIEPAVTVAQLQQTVALRADEYTEISTRSTDERNKNISRAFELISGTVLRPGDVFSFNTIVGKRTTQNGFYPAVEYVYGKEEMGIGGGVCQASTTMYLAAVAANLEITKHTPHSMQVGYTTFGKDATVNMDGKQIDFCFRNTSGSNIYITAAVQTNPTKSKEWICRVRIYGMSLGEGVSYKLIAEEIETIPMPETVYRRDTKGEYVTYTDEEKLINGREGHITRSYRVKYQGGVEVERTFLFEDVYNAAAPVIYTGIQERTY